MPRNWEKAREGENPVARQLSPAREYPSLPSLLPLRVKVCLEHLLLRGFGENVPTRLGIDFPAETIDRKINWLACIIFTCLSCI